MSYLKEKYIPLILSKAVQLTDKLAIQGLHAYYIKIARHRLKQCKVTVYYPPALLDTLTAPGDDDRKHL